MTPIKAYKILFRQYRNVLLYAIIGISALCVELLLFFMLTNFARSSIPLSNALAMSAGFVMSFTLNSLYNFGVRDKPVSRLIRFGMITFCGYWLSTAIILSLVSYVHMSSMLAKTISIPIFFIFQYTLNKRFTFRQTVPRTD